MRPGVCEMRASWLRPVSALIRLDLPTLERPGEGDLGQARRRQLGEVGDAGDERAGLGEQPPPRLEARRIVQAVRARRASPSAQADTPMRFMITHCWAIESTLFQVQ